MDYLPFALILLASGILAGILSGFLGLGGMSVYVPFLIWALHPEIPDHAQLMSAVLINSFCVVIIVGISSWLSHQGHGTIHYRKLPLLASGAVLGATLGYCLALKTGLFASMDLFFGTYLLGIGMLSLIQKVDGLGRSPTPLGTLGIGLAGGTVGGFVGFNGNSVVIPLLRNNGLNVKESMATGQLVGLTVSTVMVILIAVNFGLDQMRYDVCAALAVCGFVGSYFGARLKKQVSLKFVNQALVASCLTTGAILVFRVTH